MSKTRIIVAIILLCAGVGIGKYQCRQPLVDRSVAISDGTVLRMHDVCVVDYDRCGGGTRIAVGCAHKKVSNDQLMCSVISCTLRDAKRELFVVNAPTAVVDQRTSTVNFDQSIEVTLTGYGGLQACRGQLDYKTMSLQLYEVTSEFILNQ